MLLLRSSAGGRAPILIGWVLGLACFVYQMALPPTLNSADESFILYGAKRVLQGQALYRDFFEFLTPGSFYLYALGYAIGGTSITSARVVTALLNALSATCVYFLALHVASVAEAVIAGLLVVVVCVPVWNMAGHNWPATAFSLATAAVLLAGRWQDSTRARPAAAGAIGGLVVCTNPSRGVWLILWLVITVPALVFVRAESDRWRRCLRQLVWTAVGGAVVCFPVLGHAVWRSSLAEMIYATYTWVLTNYRSYNVGFMRWSGYLFPEALQYTYLWLFEWIPTLLELEAVALLWALWRYGLRSQLLRAALLLLALAAIGGILYFPDVVHVAFVVPFALVVLAGMVYRVRSAFVFATTPAARSVVGLAWAVVLALVLVKGWHNARLAWADNPILYETAFGTLAGRELQEGTIRDLRERLEVDGAAPPRLFAYPTDAWIYLALPADNPTPFALLRPVYNTPAQIQEALDRLKADPEAVVLLNTIVVKPDDPFLAFLNEHYRDVAGIGPPIIMGAPMYRLYAPAGKE